MLKQWPKSWSNIAWSWLKWNDAVCLCCLFYKIKRNLLKQWPIIIVYTELPCHLSMFLYPNCKTTPATKLDVPVWNPGKQVEEILRPDNVLWPRPSPSGAYEVPPIKPDERMDVSEGEDWLCISVNPSLQTEKMWVMSLNVYAPFANSQLMQC